MDVIRTLTQLIAAFADNTTRLIHPSDGRNFILTTFGAIVNRDPGVTDDKVNTSGEGWFDEGSTWNNYATRSVWKCWDGTAGAAVWKEIAGTAVGNPNLGSVEYVTIDPGGTSGFPTCGSHTLTDGETLLAFYSSSSVNAGPWVVHSGPWTRPTWFATGTIFDTDFIVEVIAGSENDGVENAPAFYRVGSATLASPPSPWTVDMTALNSELITYGAIECIGDGNIDVTPTGAQFTNPGVVFSFSLTNVPASKISGTINVTNLPSIPVSLLVGPGTIPLSLIPQIPWSDIGPGSIPDASLPNVGPGGGPYGDDSHVGQFSLDAQGRVTTASDILIAIDASQTVTGMFVDARLPNAGPGGGPYGSANSVGQFTPDAKGRIASAADILIEIDASQVNSGTFIYGRMPGLTDSVTLVSGVTCSGGSILLSYHTLDFTNGLLSGLTHFATYVDGAKVRGVREAPDRLADHIAAMEKKYARGVQP